MLTRHAATHGRERGNRDGRGRVAEAFGAPIDRWLLLARVRRGVLRSYLVSAGPVGLEEPEADYERENDHDHDQSCDQGISVGLVSGSGARLDFVEVRLCTLLLGVHALLLRCFLASIFA